MVFCNYFFSFRTSVWFINLKNLQLYGDTCHHKNRIDTADTLCQVTLTHLKFNSSFILSGCWRSWYTHAVTDRKYSFWVGFFPLFSGSVSWGSKGSLAKKRFMKVRRVSYSSFLIVARDIYQVLRSEDQGFYFYFIFYAVNYRIGGCFFILLICSLEYFFLTTVTSSTWKRWWKVLLIT